MKHRFKKNSKVFLMLLAIVLLLSSCTGNEASQSVSSSNDPSSNPPKLSFSASEKLKISFLDVGQGDCTFIQLPNGETLLIDAGNQENGTEIVQYIQNSGENTVDYLIATHPHADHIGGMSEVIKEFHIENVYMPNVSTTTVTFENLLDTIADKGLKIQTAEAGEKLFDYEGLSAVFLSPGKESYDELNNYSATLLLSYKEQKFLFMGDAEQEIENEIISHGYDVKTDLLKIGHHGSDTSSARSFLEKADPSIAVISVGADNSYGHPSPEVLETLKDISTEILRTDQHGTIVVASDGINFTLKTRMTSSQPHAPPNNTSHDESNQAASHLETEATEHLTVYITQTGTKYHLDGCRYLSKSKIAVLLSELDPNKYSPCSVCKPPNK